MSHVWARASPPPGGRRVPGPHSMLDRPVSNRSRHTLCSSRLSRTTTAQISAVGGEVLLVPEERGVIASVCVTCQGVREGEWHHVRDTQCSELNIWHYRIEWMLCWSDIWTACSRSGKLWDFCVFYYCEWSTTIAGLIVARTWSRLVAMETFAVDKCFYDMGPSDLKEFWDADLDPVSRFYPKIYLVLTSKIKLVPAHFRIDF